MSAVGYLHYEIIQLLFSTLLLTALNLVVYKMASPIRIEIDVLEVNRVVVTYVDGSHGYIKAC
jgi:hypothetical protein